MSDDALIETTIDSSIRDRAERVLEAAGMTIPELIRLTLTRTAEDGAVPFELNSSGAGEYETWVDQQIDAALADAAPGVNADEVEAHFSERRRTARLVARDR